MIRFADPSGQVIMSTRVQVRAGASRDVVLHRPAVLGGDPVVHVYNTPRAPIAAGKARVIVAQTVTMVYAVGNPENSSMDLISSIRKISSDGNVAPERIDTGSAGLAGRPGVPAYAQTDTSWTELVLGLREHAATGG